MQRRPRPPARHSSPARETTTRSRQVVVNAAACSAAASSSRSGSRSPNASAASPRPDPPRYSSTPTSTVMPSGMNRVGEPSSVTPPWSAARKLSAPALSAALVCPLAPEAGNQQSATSAMAPTVPTNAVPTPVQAAAPHKERPATCGTTARRPSDPRRAGATCAARRNGGMGPGWQTHGPIVPRLAAAAAEPPPVIRSGRAQFSPAAAAGSCGPHLARRPGRAGRTG